MWGISYPCWAKGSHISVCGKQKGPYNEAEIIKAIIQLVYLHVKIHGTCQNLDDSMPNAIKNGGGHMLLKTQWRNDNE